MRVAVLGSVEVVRGGASLDFGGRKQRALVAALALGGGRPVAVDTLVDLLWGDEAPASAVPTLHVYLAGIRRALEPDRRARTPAKIVVTVAPGYALRLPAGALDAAEFDAAVDAAHRRLGGWDTGPTRPDLTAGELTEVIDRLDAALAAWRGVPYFDLGDAPVAVAERSRLEQLRIVALEDRAVARLALGEHATVAADLESLTSEYPLRERLWVLRVLALAASGRQADALESLRTVRTLLADELGLDPGAGLRDLEGAVLRQDPALVWRPPAGPVAPAPAPVPAEARPGTDRPTAGDPRLWPLMGRRAELAALDNLVTGAGAGVPGFAAVVGEPGIGKTRLTQELAARARERGWAVLVGRCSEDEGAPPMWPWAGVLRALAEAVPADRLPEAARADLAECSAMLSLPATSGRAPAAGVAHTANEAETARFRLSSAVAGVLVAASSVRPLLVVLDDLHWADPSSLRLVHHLAEVLDAGRLVVVATHRPHPETAGWHARVAEAMSRRHALRLDLTGLSAEEAAGLVEAATDRRPTPGEAEALRERTEGNPFFLVELVRLLAARGGSDGGTTDAPPAAVTGVVARRLARLPQATGELLRTAAVAGRSFDLAVLATASGADEDRVLDDLDPALAAGLIADTERVDRFRFVHAIVREVVYAALPAARRARRHAAVAAALETAAGPDTGERSSETARHWLAAGPAYAARAWRAASTAAEQARAMCAHEEAVGLFAAAVRAQQADPAATPLDRYELFMAQADACRWLADRAGLDTALAGAVAEAERMGDIVRAARAAVATAEGALWLVRSYGQTEQRMIDVLRRALRELPADDSELRCRALLVLANELYYSDALAFREALVEQGMAMARRLGDPPLLVWACQTAYTAMWRPATATLRAALADEAVEVAVRLRDPIWEAVTRTLRAMVGAEMGRIAEMSADLRLAQDIAGPMRLTYLQIILGELAGPWLAMRGRFTELEQLIERQGERYASVSGPYFKVAAAVVHLPLRLWQDRTVELVPVFRALAGGPLRMDLDVLWMLVRSGRIDEARTEYEPSTVVLDEDGWQALFERCVVAEIAFALGHADVAREVYRWLAPYAGRCAMAGFGSALGPVDAHLALAAAAAGEREVATRHADDAMKLCGDWDIPLAARWLRGHRDRGGF